MVNTDHAERESSASISDSPLPSPAINSPATIEDKERRFSPRFFLVLSGILAICGVLSFFIDHSVSGQLAAPPHEFRFIGGDLKKLIALSEIFGHGTGVIMVVLAVFALDLENRWRVGILLGTAFGAGLTANVCKFFGVARYRPHAFDFSRPIGDSFYQWFPFLDWFDHEELRQAAYQSFPSGHSATAAGLCVGLCFLYPHARWYFLLVAGLACFQRIVFRMHFPSDVCLGAALGLLIATFLLTYGRLPDLAGWLERKIKARRSKQATA
ncbi:phosphatase PAP2 family protein [Bremerella cremea]|uniref:phosphatase PAP2 family protein n=1 Tax=Bremerella cremea TaxID=1031537 RepID=UPI0031E7BF04